MAGRPVSQDEPVVLRPATSEYLSWLRRPDPVTLAFVTVLVLVPLAAALVTWLLGGSGSGVLLLLGLVVLGVVLGLGGAMASMRTTSVTLTPSSIEHRRWVVRHAVLPREGAEGVLAPYRPPVTGQSSDLLLLRPAGRRGPRVRLNGVYWSPADLDTIAAAAGVRREDRELRARDVERRLPRALRVHERRPVLFLLLFPAAVLLLAVVAGLVVVATDDDGPEGTFPSSASREQDLAAQEVRGAVDVAWSSGSIDEVRPCDALDGGLERIVTTTAVVAGADPDALADEVVAALESVGVQDVEVEPAADGFEVVGGDGTSTFQGGATTSVELRGDELTLESRSRCEEPETS